MRACVCACGRAGVRACMHACDGTCVCMGRLFVEFISLTNMSNQW